MRTMFGLLMIAGLVMPASAQLAGPPIRPDLRPLERSDPQTRPKPSDDKAIVVTGIANGARVVEVDFDKVWKNCAECKRALAKLDKLAQAYRDESTVAREFSTGRACGGATPSPLVTFQRSSAEEVGGAKPKTLKSLSDGLCAARSQDQSTRTYVALSEKYVVPEQGKLLGYMRSFLDQLAPHIREATEAERVANNASAGLTDAKRTKVSATRLKRIDVTAAVIGRLDAKDFTIVLPDPAPLGPARGGYEPPKGTRR